MRHRVPLAPRRVTIRFALLLGGSLLALAGPAVADGRPSGGVVARGKASISMGAGLPDDAEREARTLAAVLGGGVLPVPLEILEIGAW